MMTLSNSAKEASKKEIQRLINTYEDLKKSGRYEQFGEAETCSKFIKPLFEALGWDTQGKRIIDEVTEQETAGGLKRVDYAFNINSVPVMFLEAKKLSADLDDPSFAKQAINYGYSKTVKWVILTDFEGIVVFNSLLKTKRTSERTVLKLNLSGYLDKFDDLWLLSKESIVNGQLDAHARTKGPVSEKVPINDLLLSKLLVWRNELIKGIASDNNLSKVDAAECVQRLLNRLIFIRTCEDRKIDKPKLLLNLTKDWEANTEKWLHKMLQGVFRNFDEGYDSSLFEKHLVDSVKIEGNLLDKVIKGLYEDPGEDVDFDFAVIDADILGSIYEQYLGTIQKGEGTKDKEKRKSHGIYYTPKYIVDYIVRNTLGKVLDELLKNKEYAKIGKLKVLDPACGSGSFLLKALELFDGAYENTLEFAKLPKGRKIKALCNNIYGVDLDMEAVELTKLNLLLSSTYSRKKLPSLGHNIEQGNSLIDDPKVAGDKAFDWNKRFKDVMDKGGFDAVIGNPPYLKEMDSRSIFEPIKKSAYGKYYQGKMDLWYLFLHRAIDVVKENGYIGFITNSYFLKSSGASKLIERIKQELVLLKVIDLDDIKVFGDVSGKHMIHIYQKRKSTKIDKTIYIKVDKESFSDIIIENAPIQFRYESLISDDNKIDFTPTSEVIYKNCFELGELFDVSQGVVEATDKISRKALEEMKVADINVGDGVFVLSEEEIKKLNLRANEKKLIKKYLDSNDVGRYYIKYNDEYLIYADKVAKERIKKGEYPIIKRHLDKMRAFITSSNKPYGIHRPRETKYFESPKLICKGMFASPEFSYDQGKFYVGFSFSVIIQKNDKYSLKYLLGIMNSAIGRAWFNRHGKKRGVGVDIGVLVYRKFPVHKATTKEQAPLIKLVDNILDLNNKYLKVRDKHTSEADRLKRQIEETDSDIDDLVYKLYGLTEEDIKVVEGNSK